MHKIWLKFLKKYKSRNAKNNIFHRKNDKYTNTKNYTDNTCAKIMSYIQKI